MKASKGIVLFNSIAICALIVSCVKDYEFGNGNFSKYAEVKQENNCITFTSDIDKESIFGAVSEKGFITLLKYNSGDEISRIKLKPEDKFEYTLTDDLTKGIGIAVIPYIIDNGHEFKGRRLDFVSKVNGLPMHINSVDIAYDDDTHITGKVIIAGSHLGKFRKDIMLFNSYNDPYHQPDFYYNKQILGEEKYRLLSATNDTLIFSFENNNIGEHTLILREGENQLPLSKKLNINTASVVNFNPEAILGIPHDVNIELRGIIQEEVGCSLEKKQEMTASNHFYKEKKTQVIFAVDQPGTYKAYFFFMRNGKKVYLPPCDVNIKSNWTKACSAFNSSTTVITSSNNMVWRMWDAGDQNQHSNESIIIESIDPTTGNHANYSYSYTNYEEPWRNIDNYYLTADGEDIYFSVSLKSTTNPSKVSRYIRVLAIKPGDSKPQLVGDVMYETTAKKKNYELFAKVGDVYYFEDKDSDMMMTWRSTDNTIEYHPFKFGYYKYIGRDNTYFFYLYNYYNNYAIYRMPINELGKIDKLDLDANLSIKCLGRNDNHTHWSNNFTVYNGRIYQANIMRSTSTTDLNDHVYYGLPDTNNEILLLPCKTGIYCHIPWHDIMKVK